MERMILSSGLESLYKISEISFLLVLMVELILSIFSRQVSSVGGGGTKSSWLGNHQKIAGRLSWSFSSPVYLSLLASI